MALSQPSRSDQVFTSWTMGIVMAHCPVGNQTGCRAWVLQMDPMTGMRHCVGSTLGKAQFHCICDVSELDVAFPRDQLYRSVQVRQVIPERRLSPCAEQGQGGRPTLPNVLGTDSVVQGTGCPDAAKQRQRFPVPIEDTVRGFGQEFG